MRVEVQKWSRRVLVGMETFLYEIAHCGSALQVHETMSPDFYFEK